MASQHQTFYPFAEVQDDYGNHYTRRMGRATRNFDQALRTLRRVDHGEIRDEHNTLVAIKDPTHGVRLAL